jgi:DNA polymerase-3 subunit gamma/tau
MLSKGAFNALLKILEEPPSYVKFILATTETHKVPDTIISRCQRYDMKNISVSDIKSRLEFIA